MKALKLKDVIHLYIGFDIEYMWHMDFMTTKVVPATLYSLNSTEYSNHKLRLHHLKDMTFEHAKEIGLIPEHAALVRRITTGMTYKYETHFGIQDGWLNPQYKYKEFTPSQTVIASKLGYDLFGLIESGEDKDKTYPPVKAVDGWAVVKKDEIIEIRMIMNKPDINWLGYHGYRCIKGQFIPDNDNS